MNDETFHGSAGDELLRWISETGSGGWESLRDASAYVCQKHNVKRRPWTLASDLSALGHVDIDWSSRKWSVAPPVLNLIPGMGLCIVLSGSRPHYVDQRFDEATDDLAVYPFSIPQPPAPAVKLSKCASVDVAHQVADALHAPLVVNPALSLVEAMPQVDEVRIEHAPPPSLENSERFNPETLQWQGQLDEEPGLYRVDLHGRPVYRRLDEYGDWWQIELAAGQFLAIQDGTRPVIRWIHASGRSRQPSAFEIRNELSLPIHAERALTTSSGLLPKREHGWRKYINVPRELAEMIATRLLQQLSVDWSD